MSSRRLLYLLLWAVILMLIVPLYLRIAWVDPVDYDRGGLGSLDFKAYYIAARLLAADQNIYDAGLHAREMVQVGLVPDNVLYLYPSPLATTLLPLAALPLETAARIWNTANFLLLVATVGLVTMTFELRRILGAHYPWFIVLLALAAPVVISLRIGQANTTTLFFVALGLWAWREGRDWVSGLALACATLLKLVPGLLLLWFIWRRRYRIVNAFVIGVGGILGLNALFLWASGRNMLLDWTYFTEVLPRVTAPHYRDNQALAGFITRFQLPWPLGTIVLAICGAALLAITLAVIFRLGRDDRTLIGLGLVVSAMMLLSTISWTTTLIFLLIPFAVLIYAWERQRGLGLAAAGAALSYLLLSIVHWAGTAGVAVPHNLWVRSVPFLGSLLLWATLVIAGLRCASAPDDHRQPAGA